jgi:hypothetical protein
MSTICDETFPLFSSQWLNCQFRAYVYFQAVSLGGGDAYSQGQDQACGQPGGAAAGGSPPGDPPLPDADNDLMPDEWELLVGLDPTNPLDALQDPDGDGLNNIEEYLHDMNPFDPDTLGNGLGDLNEVLAMQPPAAITVNDAWTVEVKGQIAQPGPLGHYTIANVPVIPSNAAGALPLAGNGTGAGTGSTAELARVTGVGIQDGQTVYMVSDFFELDTEKSNQVSVQGVAITKSFVPPIVPVSITTDAGSIVLEPGDVGQVTVSGEMSDGTQADLSLRSTGTTYRTTNPSVAIVDINGQVLAVSPGIAFITATNGGASLIKRVDVVSEAVETTAQGIVQFVDGAPRQTWTSQPVSAALRSPAPTARSQLT